VGKERFGGKAGGGGPGGVLQTLEALFSGIASSDHKKRDPSERKLRDLCYRCAGPGNENLRRKVSERLAEAAASGRNREVRRYVLRLIERIGGAEVVGKLAGVLRDPDPELRERARRALQSNPAPGAAQALLRELSVAKDPAWKIALANALGERREKRAVGALRRLVLQGQGAVQEAACAALGKIGGVEACNALLEFRKRCPKEILPSVTEACLRAAESVEESGDKETARSIYRVLSRKTEALHVRTAALRALRRLER